jgi:glycosyltransferase involved in cell wall biosynthesis
MVMDLLWRHFPDEFLANHNLERTFLENLRNVDVVFPVSDATAAEMASAFDLSGINVVSVPHGAELPLAEDEGLAMPTDLPSNFFLYPAQITENKNHVCLFEAVRILAGQGAVCSLVCTSRAISRLRNGTITSSYDKRLRRWLDVNEDLLDSHIDLRGEVAWLELETLYRGCNAVILPSFYEGFGLPLVEAFEFNAPVICSEITPFREQVKRYGMEDRTIWVDPMTPKALANTMLAVLEKPRSLPLPYSELTHRLGMWTWDDAVRVYLKNLEVA